MTKAISGLKGYCEFCVVCSGQVLYEGSDWRRAIEVESYCQGSIVKGYEGEGDWTILRRNGKACEPTLDIYC